MQYHAPAIIGTSVGIGSEHNHRFASIGLFNTDVCAYLLEAAKVTVVPGEAFGSPGYFRVSYAVGIDQLVEACDRIQLACEKLERT